ncbi:MAG: hypothetical protein JO189_31570 [Deltaproteobacteria bacterium]|nr:hypothetical protein [Deltaproteobacteria bacterium]
MSVGVMYADDSLDELACCGIEVAENILPSQFHDLFQRSGERSPEHRLMMALLEDALHCWLNSTAPGIFTTVKREKAHREADAWIFGGYCAPLTFVQVCSWLNLDPEYIRRELLKRGESDVPLPRYKGSGRVRKQCGLRTKINSFSGSTPCSPTPFLRKREKGA